MNSKPPHRNHVGPRESTLQPQGESPLKAQVHTKADLKQFTAKQLNRQAAKAGKDEQAERAKLKKVRSNSSRLKAQG
jgi:hypothetical protein